MLKIGEIIGSHGIQGEVKVYSLTDFPRRFYELDVVTVQLGSQSRQLHIEKVRQHKNIFIIQFQEVRDRNRADELKNWLLVVDYVDAIPLPSGHYYDFQLVGMGVWDLTTETLIGKLTEVLHLPANAVYQVERTDGSIVLIPALKQIVRSVDVAEKRMGIMPLEGLLE